MRYRFAFYHTIGFGLVWMPICGFILYNFGDFPLSLLLFLYMLSDNFRYALSEFDARNEKPRAPTVKEALPVVRAYVRSRCEQCGGAGWMWAHELGIGGMHDDTKYACRGRGGTEECELSHRLELLEE